MPILNRKAKGKAVNDEGAPTQTEKVKFSKRPASKFNSAMEMSVDK